MSDFDYTQTRDFINTLFPGWERMAGQIPCLARPRAFTREGKEVHYYDQFALAGDGALKMIEDEPGDWYVCVSTVEWDGRRKVKRKKDDCVELHAIMLDDIGTKAKAPPLLPTAVVETSEGNYQYWYRLEEPIALNDANREHVEALYKALAEAGYGDKGATGVNRVARVPGAINTKPGRGEYQAQLTELNVGAVVTLDEMISTTGVKVAKTNRPRKASGRATTVDYSDEHDPVVAWLKASGEVCEPPTGSSDFWTVTCPWAHQHSDGRDEAGYSPLGFGAEPEIRGFKCLHESHIDKSIEHYLGWVQEQGGPSVGIDGGSDEDRKAAAARIAQVMKQTGFDPFVGAPSTVSPPTSKGATPPPVTGITPADAFQLIADSMPQLSRNQLPDAVFSAQGGTSKVQEKTVANVQWVLEQCGFVLRFNMLTKQHEMTFSDPGLAALAAGLTVDQLFTILASQFTNLGIKGLDELRGTVEALAELYPYHPGEEWLRSLKWDGTDHVMKLFKTMRLDEGMPPELGYTYLRKWLIQGVQAWCGWRAPQSMPYVLTIVGKQGIGKTYWFRQLMPMPIARAFGEGESINFGGLNRKDEVERATAHMLVELGELDTTFRRSDAGALKAFLSSPEDSYRSAYARSTRTWPRTTIFGASVNDREYLVDPTGSRRFMGIAVRALERASLDMAQVWAQSFAAWEQGESYFLTEAEMRMQSVVNDRHVMSSSHGELWAEWFEQRDAKGPCRAMTMNDICEEIGVHFLNLSPAAKRELRAAIERSLGERRERISALPDGTKLPGQGVKRAWLVPTVRLGMRDVPSSGNVADIFKGPQGSDQSPNEE